MKIEKLQSPDRDKLILLLKEVKLPTKDLKEDMNHFFILRLGDNVIGGIGLELYGKDGLLRSLVVHPSNRNKGYASNLVDSIEKEANVLNLENIYLLTETAQDFFRKRNYEIIERNEASPEIKESSEFSHACPASATLMRKKINP